MLIKYYKLMLNSQNINPSDLKLNRMAQLVNNLCKNKIANMFFVRESNGKISYVIVFGFDSKNEFRYAHTMKITGKKTTNAPRIHSHGYKSQSPHDGSQAIHITS